MRLIDSRGIAAAILAVGLLAASFAHRSPRYELRQQGSEFFRFDNQTGQLAKISIVRLPE